MSLSLIVSVSGIRDRSRADVDRFARLLDDRGVPTSLLVAPRLAGGYRLADDAPTVEWLHDRRSGGDAILLHGYDEAATKSRRPEFADLTAHEAALRLTAADRMLEALDLRTRLFAAPGWTVSPQAVAVLPRSGFRLLVGADDVVDLVRGTAERARVLGIGNGYLTEPWWCRAVVLAAQRTARRGGTVRLAVSAKQLARPAARQAMLDAVDLALLAGATPAVYRWRPDAALADAA